MSHAYRLDHAKVGRQGTADPQQRNVHCKINCQKE